MADVAYSEAQRLILQRELDERRTQLERNRLGQFATPPALAQDILLYTHSLIEKTQAIRFLDPAIGTGAFYAALRSTFSDVQITSAIGYEIDPGHASAAHELWADNGLNLRIADFTRVTPPKAKSRRANLLICNPPYVRHHHISRTEKQRLQQRVAPILQGHMSELAGFYCYFLLLAHQWMAPNAIAGWLIPSEWMDVNYGQQIKIYLRDKVTLLRIHRFDAEQSQFDDALVSSVVVWFRNASPPSDAHIEFTSGNSLLKPRHIVSLPRGVLQEQKKWSQLFMPTLHVSHPSPTIKLSEIFTIQRGLATGANEFFIMTEAQAEQRELPREFLIPILPSARSLAASEIGAREDGTPDLRNRLYLLSCDVDEDIVREKYPALWRYLQIGRRQGISDRYLCKHRRVWYFQEKRQPSPILCTYMGRKGKDGIPFRFIANHSQAIAANTYLLLYPKEPLKRILTIHPERLIDIRDALGRITPEDMIREGRVYGGGLHKVEPKELANFPADEIIAAFPELLGDRHTPDLDVISRTGVWLSSKE